LSDKEITVVFANIEDILLTNTVSLPSLHSVRVFTAMLQAFLSSLEKHQKECRLYIDKIGDILLSHIPNMGVYMVGLLNSSYSSTLSSLSGVLRQSVCGNQNVAVSAGIEA
jgi:hypothetical protein